MQRFIYSVSLLLGAIVVVEETRRPSQACAYGPLAKFVLFVGLQLLVQTAHHLRVTGGCTDTRSHTADTRHWKGKGGYRFCPAN